MRSLGRLRVPGGIFTVLLALLVVVLAFNAAAAEIPRKLVVPQTGAYSASLLVIAGEDPVEHDFSRCASGPSGAVVRLPAGGATILRNAGVAICASGFALIDAPEGATSLSVIRFDDGASRVSLPLPPIGALAGDGYVRVGPLIVDDEEGAWITVFAAYPGTPILVRLIDAENPLSAPIVEKFKASPPVTQYAIAARGIFFAEIFLGVDFTYRCWPGASCDVFGSVYGFASSGSADGGNFRPYVF
jgi:hypothetical protein